MRRDVTAHNAPKWNSEIASESWGKREKNDWIGPIQSGVNEGTVGVVVGFLRRNWAKMIHEESEIMYRRLEARFLRRT